MKKPMEDNMNFFGIKSIEEKYKICEETSNRFKWTKRFICPLRRIKYESDYSIQSSSSESSSSSKSNSLDPMMQNGFKNLDSPFGESKNEIDIEDLGDAPALIPLLNQPDDPFKRNEFYQLAQQGMGPWSFRYYTYKVYI